MPTFAQSRPSGSVLPKLFFPWEHQDDPFCFNCRYWSRIRFEADGRSVGSCRMLSGDGWRYGVIPLGPDETLSLQTRCDFGCNQFSRKPPTTGWIEPEIEDEP